MAAALCSMGVTPPPCNSNINPEHPSIFFNPKPLLRSIHPFRTPKTQFPKATSKLQNDQKTTQESMSIDALHRFIHLNLGNWTGSFHQFDSDGNLLHKVDTRLSAGSYGDGDLISLIQTLYIKQSSSSSSVSGNDYEPEWAEYKIKETNMFTAEKYQQSTDWIFPPREGICTKVPDSWHASNCIKTRSARRR